MAAPRLHIGPVRAPTVLGVLVAGVLLCALVVTGRWQHRPALQPATPSPAAEATTPVSLGPIWTCPLVAPIPGFADHHSYPPGHPAAPARTLRPVACYSTTGQAAAAGYPPAPLPAGTLTPAACTWLTLSFNNASLPPLHAKPHQPEQCSCEKRAQQ